VTEFKKRSHISVSAIWFKSPELKDLHYYFSKQQFEYKNADLTDANLLPVSEQNQ